MASNTFSLKIISANRVFFTGRCQSVIVPGYDGQKEVLAHHENMVIAVNEGEMRFLPEGEEKWQYAVVGIGFIEIVNNRVTLLVERGNRYRKSTGSKGESFGKNTSETEYSGVLSYTGFPFSCDGETSSWT